MRRTRLGLSGAVVATASVCLLAGTGAAGTGGHRPAYWRVVTLRSPSQHRAFSYAEPGIAINGQTAMIVTATANAGIPPTLWLSRDDGRDWTRGKDFDPTGASTGDSDVAIGRDGWLYALNLAYGSSSGQPVNPTVQVFRSRNARTWHGPAKFPPPHGSDQPDRPWLFVDPRHPAHVDLVNSEVSGNIVLWRSTNHAASFTGPTPVTGGVNSQAALALSSRPLFDPTKGRRIYLLYETITAAGLRQTLSAGPPVYEFPATQVWLASSTDGGASWRNRLVLDTGRLASPKTRDGTLGHLLVASAIDRAGRLYVAFSLRPLGGSATGIYVIHSTDHGSSWSVPALVPTPTRSNVMPAVAVGAGHVYLSWYGSATSSFKASAARWYEMFAVSSDSLARHPSFVVRRLSGRPVHVGGIDTAGAIASDLGSVSPALGANWGLRDFQGIAVDACGRPHPVWASDVGRGATLTATRPADAGGCRSFSRGGSR